MKSAIRNKLSIEVDPTVLLKYQKILDAKNGFAIAKVVANACGGCHMQLPSQVINEIRLKSEIVYCQTCSRILCDSGEES